MLATTDSPPTCSPCSPPSRVAVRTSYRGSQPRHRDLLLRGRDTGRSGSVRWPGLVGLLRANGLLDPLAEGASTLTRTRTRCRTGSLTPLSRWPLILLTRRARASSSRNSRIIVVEPRVEVSAQAGQAHIRRGPTGALIMSSETGSLSWAKCRGSGSSWAASPGIASLDQSRCIVLRAPASSGPQNTLRPPCTVRLPPPDSR